MPAGDVKVVRRLASLVEFLATCVLIAVLWVALWFLERCLPNGRRFLP